MKNSLERSRRSCPEYSMTSLSKWDRSYDTSKRIGKIARKFVLVDLLRCPWKLWLPRWAFPKRQKHEVKVQLFLLLFRCFLIDITLLHSWLEIDPWEIWSRILKSMIEEWKLSIKDEKMKWKPKKSERKISNVSLKRKTDMLVLPDSIIGNFSLIFQIRFLFGIDLSLQ